MSKMKRLAKKVLLSLAASMISALPSACALPDQGNYDNSFYASIVVNGNVMNIDGNYGNNIINWRTFSVGSGETVKFMDKNNYLNLVNGIEMSKINGTISGGGIVYLINPYGILFGSGATLDNVGSFVASTRDISDINQTAFLNDPKDTQKVLFTDNHASRNPDYFPSDSSFAPAISVAEIKLTNSPGGATKIMLDGSNGVILKDMDVFDEAYWISTKGTGGEVGIGTKDGKLPTLTSAQKEKIFLTSGTNWASYQGQSGVVQPYKQISNISELQAINEDIEMTSAPYRYVLNNDIDASSVNFQTLGGGRNISGKFDGLGYNISNLKNNGNGLFGYYSGTIRNLSLTNANITSSGDSVGGVAGIFAGNMQNVEVAGHISGKNNVGGLVGYVGGTSEIRNSVNKAEVHGQEQVGGMVGDFLGKGYLIDVANMGNVYGSYRIGGIMGNFYCSGTNRLLFATNKGNIEGSLFIGGLIGNSNNEYVGNAFNFGLVIEDGFGDSWGALGGISGYYSWFGFPYYQSEVTGQKLSSYYNRENVRGLKGVRGHTSWTNLNDADLQAKFEETRSNLIATRNVTTPKIETPVVVPEPEPVDDSNNSNNPNNLNTINTPYDYLTSSNSNDKSNSQSILTLLHEIETQKPTTQSNYRDIQKFHIDSLTPDIMRQNSLKELEIIKNNNAAIEYKGSNYYSSTGESSPFGEQWNKIDEIIIKDQKYDILDGLKTMIQKNELTDEPKIGNKLDAVDSFTGNLLLPFLEGFVKNTYMKVEFHEFDGEHKLVIKIKADGTENYLNQKILLGGSSYTDMSRMSDKIKRAYPHLDQNKFYTAEAFISDYYLNNPFDYYIEFDKNLNGYLIPIIPPNSSFKIRELFGGYVYDMVNDLASLKIKLSENNCKEILNLLEVHGFSVHK